MRTENEPAPSPEIIDEEEEHHHEHWVQLLKERGESILMPKGEPMNSVEGYIKTENPHMTSGGIYKGKDGNFELYGDFGRIHVKGIKWEDLGLCDKRKGYEWRGEKWLENL